jgi:hypothetical protein
MIKRVRNKMGEYLKSQINEVARNNKNRNIKDFYKGRNDLKVC